jgi:exo-beta-1,3-glucanase (GH17 family)
MAVCRQATSSFSQSSWSAINWDSQFLDTSCSSSASGFSGPARSDSMCKNHDLFPVNIALMLGGFVRTHGSQCSHLHVMT